MGFDGEKAASRSKGVLGPLFAAAGTLFMAFGGVDLTSDLTALTNQVSEAIILVGTLCALVVGIYGRIVAAAPITSLFKK